MTPIFGRGPSLPLRLFFSIVLSAALMFADSRLDAFSAVRHTLNSMVTPIQYAADLPRTLFEGVYEKWHSRKQLIESNASLKREVLLLKSDLGLLRQYQEENERLRKLLNSPFIRDEKKVVTEVMAIDSSPYRHQVVIDKGSTDGVYVGQPVINESGIVGLVTLVAAHNARVLLLIDSNNAIPVQVVRNDIRVIASGSGDLDTIFLEHIPLGTDIREGDLLVTSGLGGVYPEGYPVGYVSSVDNDSSLRFAKIETQPLVKFERLRYLLLIWPNKDRQRQVILSSNDIESNSANRGTVSQ